jgi:hypothetical protein
VPSPLKEKLFEFIYRYVITYLKTWLSKQQIYLATQEAEIRRIVVLRQPKQIVHETLSLKNPSQKWASGVVQSVGTEIKL